MSRFPHCLSLNPPPLLQLIWFLAPHVELASQQAKVIEAQIPSVQTRLLTGSDGVEYWSKQCIWDTVLNGIRIVVSTHQVLLDALIHGFVQMARLSLMVFDEAHHCIADHPASRILRDFYHPCLAANNGQAPAILGLTASPVVNNKAGKLEQLESNLQAISRTPRLSREELLHHVNKPTLVRLAYPSELHDTPRSQLLLDLHQLRSSLDIEQDPFVKKLMSGPEPYDPVQLRKLKLSRKTYCQEQLKNLSTRAEIIQLELGPWAADWYIKACIRKFQQVASHDTIGLRMLDDREKVYLYECLTGLLPSIPEDDELTDDAPLSSKFLCLAEYLLSQLGMQFTGLLFVRTRAEVAVLAQLLSLHPKTKALLTVGTFVGVSSTASRKANIGDLIDIRGQIHTLDDLRFGRKNLVIATSALEEGIDVTACNTVICFEKPPNLISVIQRRGRARKSESKFVIMLADDADPSVITTWEKLEQEMQRQYMDDMRQLQGLEALEETDEGYREFVVEQTGAKLLLADAASHLYHFCATLTTGPLSNRAPVFSVKSVGKNLFTTTVILPISVDASVREASSSAWKTEKAAKRDAAFEAYIQLYRAGLVSDNLLPVEAYDELVVEIQTEVAKVASLVEIAGQLNPWHLVARDWQARTNRENLSTTHCFDVSLLCNDEAVAAVQMILPCNLPVLPTIPLYWDARTMFRSIISPRSASASQSTHPHVAAQSTALLLRSVFRYRMNVEATDFVAFFLPGESENPLQWTQQYVGTIKSEELKPLDVSTLPLNRLGMARSMSQGGLAHVVRGFQIGSLEVPAMERQSTERDEAGFYLQVSKFPKRTDFLHKVSEQDEQTPAKHYTTLLKAEDCEIDKLPIGYAYFAAIVPCVMHRVGCSLIGAHLCNTLLAPASIENLELVLTAITTSAAQEPTNYQRQEFLGDSVLKFLTSLTLTSDHLRWPEGHLSRAKDHIVSNASLAKAALAIGLDKFIITKPFTGSKWRPLYVADQLGKPTGQPRLLSTKTLADVVEALIGAAFLDGGFRKAIELTKIFLRKPTWSMVEDKNEILHTTHQASESSIICPHHFVQLEELVGYNFTLKSLALEALTDSSYMGPNVTTSYERLEFLGDTCLDIIVATTSFNHEPPIKTHGLHLIRSAVVNADFLAFLSLTLCVSVPRATITTGNRKNDVSVSQALVPLHLWNFMRHASPTVRHAQQGVIERYESLETSISESLQRGSHIPWALLARLGAPKFLSDIIESVVGAIYIDSHGSLTACEAFLERLGVMGYLRRLLDGGVALYHPKEELGQLADTETVRYEVFREEGEEKRFGCVVRVGESEVAKVGDGLCAMEVETRAAEEAVRLLKGERGDAARKRKFE
ncbi:MAG: hypothetical protein L6R35_000238 [Caloplaca aegaea]|nr:MAG: hypothetical protein L6R35_000238 [Caloplaca aegaea]